MFSPENLPNILKQLEDFKALLAREGKPLSIWKYLDDCQEALRKTHESLSNPKQKEMLGEILAKVAEKRAEFQSMVPGIVADLRKKEQESIEWIRNFPARVEQTKQKVQDKLHAEKELAASLEQPPPAAPEVPIDLHHGAGLAQELLQALGMQDTVAAKEKKGFEDAGSVARRWSDTDSESDAAPAGNRPATPPPPAKTERPILKPRPATPLRRPPPRDTMKPIKNEPDLDASIGKDAFEDE